MILLDSDRPFQMSGQKNYAMKRGWQLFIFH